MMLLTETKRTPLRTTLTVEGWLTSEDCHILASECSALLDQGQWLRLECKQVSYLDIRGAETLLGLNRRRVEIVGLLPVRSYVAPRYNGRSRRP